MPFLDLLLGNTLTRLVFFPAVACLPLVFFRKGSDRAVKVYALAVSLVELALGAALICGHWGGGGGFPVVRDGGERNLSVTLSEAPASGSARTIETPDSQAALGITVAPLTPELAASAGLPRGTRGLLVQEVDLHGAERIIDGAPMVPLL